MKWITDRKRDLALLEAHQNLVDTLGDLNAAVIVGQLSIPGVMTMMESAEASTKAALPLALEALEAVLELNGPRAHGDYTMYSDGYHDALEACREAITEKLGEKR